MPNPYGVNQLGSDRVPYGAAKKMKQLAAEAPMSGAPIAAPALNAPQQARQAGGQPPVTPGAAPGPPANPQPVPTEPVSYNAQLAETWAQIAATPGASDLVKQMAQEAQLGR